MLNSTIFCHKFNLKVQLITNGQFSFKKKNVLNNEYNQFVFSYNFLNNTLKTKMKYQINQERFLKSKLYMENKSHYFYYILLGFFFIWPIFVVFIAIVCLINYLKNSSFEIVYD